MRWQPVAGWCFTACLAGAAVWVGSLAAATAVETWRLTRDASAEAADEVEGELVSLP